MYKINQVILYSNYHIFLSSKQSQYHLPGQVYFTYTGIYSVSCIILKKGKCVHISLNAAVVGIFIFSTGQKISTVPMEGSLCPVCVFNK